MYDLQKMTLRDMSECGCALRSMSNKAHSMEDTTNNIIDYLYNNLVDKQTGEKSCVLIRFFKTHPYGELTPELQDYVCNILGDKDLATHDLKCLTLLATAGELPAWNSRYQSERYKAIPLTDKNTIARIPMIAQVISQLGLDLDNVIKPDANLIAYLEQKIYNVFYVPDALESDYITAKSSFVVPFNVKSVIGIGGLLPSGNMFVVLMFLKNNVPRFTTNLLRPLALNVKMAILPFDNNIIFHNLHGISNNLSINPENNAEEIKRLNSQIQTLNTLLEVSEKATINQSDRLEEAIANLQTTVQKLRETQVQLIHTEKMSSLGQMVAGIAHEINNPINYVYGNIFHTEEHIHNLLQLIDLYQQKFPETPAEIQDFIEDIGLEYINKDINKIIKSMQLGTERITQIVESLRNFSRIDNSSFKKSDIHSGIDSTLMILEHRMKSSSRWEKNIKVIKEYGNIPEVECSLGQINQVFMNILSNGIDALHEKSNRNKDNLENKSGEMYVAKILIKTFIENDKWAVISIADNGLGVPQEVQDKLFDPFFTTKPMGKGTGIGLSISHQIIVEKHGGKIICNSTPGQGTEFIIKIPLTRF